MIKTKYMFSEAKVKAKANDMTSCPRGASRPTPWPRGLHLWPNAPSKTVVMKTEFDMKHAFKVIRFGINYKLATDCSSSFYNDVLISKVPSK